ncbi:hypothetical protein [Dactylosporangium aurantiacum]|nr:hypothetical protein [Dactylosporangium aurantiacum]MDG6108778.1 hypothetical protein [Dactylosporangium aurantiacum]
MTVSIGGEVSGPFQGLTGTRLVVVDGRRGQLKQDDGQLARD